MVADTLRNRGTHFHIVNLSVDTSTPVGMLVYTVMASVRNTCKGSHFPISGRRPEPVQKNERYTEPPLDAQKQLNLLINWCIKTVQQIKIQILSRP